jgi:hypothetical protein
MPRSRHAYVDRWNSDRDSFSYQMRERLCTKCEVWQLRTTDNFSYNSNRSIWQAWCKSCMRAYAAERRLNGVAPTTGRRFGVEIEFLGSGEAVARAMRAQGLTCTVQSYNHHVSRSAWKVVPDGSVPGGMELVSPILRGTNGFAQIVKAGLALAAAEVRVDKSTGLHVHHDIHDIRVSAFQRLVKNWAACQNAIDGLVAPSRRKYGSGRRWCQEVSYNTLSNMENLRNMDKDHARYCLQGDRYEALNVQSYCKYGTVEIRQHNGTLDANKIINWVRFGQAFIDAAVTDMEFRLLESESTITIIRVGPCADENINSSDTHALLDALPLLDEAKEFLHRRARRFASVSVRS